MNAITIWLTGLSGSGKSTIAKAIKSSVLTPNDVPYILDGDEIRKGLCSDLAFSHQDRTENIRRIAEVAKLFNNAGLSVIVAFISPYKKDRKCAKEIIGKNNFLEIFVDAPLATCEARDIKGLYKQARAGILKNFTGISTDSPYEQPENPDINLHTDKMSIKECIEIIYTYIKKKNL